MPASHRVFLATTQALNRLLQEVNISEAAMPPTARVDAHHQQMTGSLFPVLAAWEHAYAEAGTSLPNEAAGKSLVPFIAGLPTLPAAKDGQPWLQAFPDEVTAVREHLVKGVGALLKSVKVEEMPEATLD